MHSYYKHSLSIKLFFSSVHAPVIRKQTHIEKHQIFSWRKIIAIENHLKLIGLIFSSDAFRNMKWYLCLTNRFDKSCCNQIYKRRAWLRAWYEHINEYERWMLWWILKCVCRVADRVKHKIYNCQDLLYLTNTHWAWMWHWCEAKWCDQLSVWEFLGINVKICGRYVVAL